MPETVEAFINAMGHETFTLMGFSFGGLLALRTLEHLHERIDKVILLSPCVSRRALKWPTYRQWLFRASVNAMKNSYVLRGTHYVLNMPYLETPLTYALSKVSNIDRRILQEKNAIRMPLSTLDVFTYTVDEILKTEYAYPDAPFDNPCYYGMSVHDDLLDYEITTEVVQQLFSTIISVSSCV